MDALARDEMLSVVRLALAEDVGSGDLTTLAVVPPGLSATGVIAAREPLVVAGLEVARLVFQEISPALTCAPQVSDGQRVETGAALLRLSGSAGAMLTGERVALNFLQRLSGIATLTRQFVDAVGGTRAVILDTRKTTPGLRRLEKAAVVSGGGQNHRMGLYDAILIKDNHLAALAQETPDPIGTAVRRARQQFPGRTVEVEADTLEQVHQAVEAGADLILLDNMNPIQLRLAVQTARGRARTEASGGVGLATVRAIAESGVDFISVGALTHSARAMDIALDLEIKPAAPVAEP